MKSPYSILAVATALATASLVFAKPVNNQELLKLLSAKVSDDIVLTVINSSNEKTFDTSADAITELKKAGASDAVIKAMFGAPTVPAASKATAGTPATSADAITKDTVLVVKDASEVPVQYTAAETRMAARALGMGGAAIYAVLPGSTATTTLGSTPEFIVSVPSNANPVSHYQLASFALRKNGNREVSIGGGFTSVSIGIHPDRVIALDFQKLPDQSRAAAGQALYKIKPKNTLAPGQYALVAKLSGSAGLGGAQISGQWYDFDVR